MLIEWAVKEKFVKYLTIFLRETELYDGQKTDVGTVYKQIQKMQF